MSSGTWRDFPELSERQSLGKLIEQHWTIANIAAVLGCSPRSVETAIKRHHLKGYLALMKARKRWGLEP